MRVARLVWDRGEAEMQALGAMLAPASLALPDGRRVHPLHVAPWEGEDLSGQPGILRRLRGEWPCVPFGMAPAEPLPAAWAGVVRGAGDADAGARDPHGYGSNHEWQLEQDGPAAIRARIDYPDDSAIARLERRVEGVAGEAALRFGLTIHPRRDCRLPIGLHPVFALPAEPGAAHLTVDHTGVAVHPLDEGPGLSRLAPGLHFDRLARLSDRQGHAFDGAALPYAIASENLLLLTGVTGEAVLENRAGGYRTRLSWDAALFPALMLWISNRGRQSAPWSGRHLALGMEPVRAAFDLGPGLSAGDNPLTRAGVETAFSFRAGEPLSTEYRIAVEPL